MKVTVFHTHYRCDSGCCGHQVELEDGTKFGFDFDHPSDSTDTKEWALEFAKAAVLVEYGKNHIVDLDWDSCAISRD